jgi:hypothetical protein
LSFGLVLLSLLSGAGGEDERDDLRRTKLGRDWPRETLGRDGLRIKTLGRFTMAGFTGFWLKRLLSPTCGCCERRMPDFKCIVTGTSRCVMSFCRSRREYIPSPGGNVAVSVYVPSS